MIDREALIDEVMWLGGTGERSTAEGALEAVLEAIAEHLPAADRKSIADQLPPRFATAMAVQGRPGRQLPAHLFPQLAAREKISLGQALEHVRAACWALTEFLDGETRTLLGHRLPAEWAELFTPPPMAIEADIPPGTVPGHGHTLATGQPGSRHSLAEADPRRAQGDSVVRAENPHGDSKLSSAGVQDAEDRLASGRPRPLDSLADAKDERSR